MQRLAQMLLLFVFVIACLSFCPSSMETQVDPSTCMRTTLHGNLSSNLEL